MESNVCVNKKIEGASANELIEHEIKCNCAFCETFDDCWLQTKHKTKKNDELVKANGEINEKVTNLEALMKLKMKRINELEEKLQSRNSAVIRLEENIKKMQDSKTNCLQ